MLRWLVPVALSFVLIGAGYSPTHLITSTYAQPPTAAAPCAPASPILPGTVGGEVQGATQKGQLWALLFYSPPAQAGTQEKIVWRMTGKGSFYIEARGPGGQVMRPN